MEESKENEITETYDDDFEEQSENNISLGNESTEIDGLETAVTKSDKEKLEFKKERLERLIENSSMFDTLEMRLEQAGLYAEKYALENNSEESLKYLIRAHALSQLLDLNNSSGWRQAKYLARLAHGYIDLKGSNYFIQSGEHAKQACRILQENKTQLNKFLLNQNSDTSGVDFMNFEHEKLEILRTFVQANFAMARSSALDSKFDLAEKFLIQAMSYFVKLKHHPMADETENTELEIRLLMAAAKIALHQQKFTESIDFCKNLTQIIESFLSDSDSQFVLRLIEVYQLAGQVEQMKGNLANHSQAINMYKRAVEFSRSRFSAPNMIIANSLIELGKAYSRTNDTDMQNDAELIYREALAMHKELNLNNIKCDNYSSVELELIKLLVRQGKNELGLDILKKNINLAKGIYGEYSNEYMERLKFYASIQMMENDLTSALKFYKKVLAIEEIKFSSNSKQIRQTMLNIKSIKENPLFKINADAEKIRQDRPPFRTYSNK